MKDYILWPIGVILFFCAVYFIPKYRNATRKAKIKDLAAWTITEWSKHIRDFELHVYIANAQTRLPKEYCIFEEEDWNMAKEILSSLQKYMYDQMLVDKLILPKTKREITGEDFFMIYLQSYLENHQGDNSFIGHDLFERHKPNNGYSSRNGSQNEVSLTLTQFGMVLQKLHYISYCYCKNNKSINPKGLSYKYEKYIEENIRAGKFVSYVNK